MLFFSCQLFDFDIFEQIKDVKYSELYETKQGKVDEELESFHDDILNLSIQLILNKEKKKPLTIEYVIIYRHFLIYNQLRYKKKHQSMSLKKQMNLSINQSSIIYHYNFII